LACSPFAEKHLHLGAGFLAEVGEARHAPARNNGNNARRAPSEFLVKSWSKLHGRWLGQLQADCQMVLFLRQLQRRHQRTFGFRVGARKPEDDLLDAATHQRAVVTK